jgi:hypothetical protein
MTDSATISRYRTVPADPVKNRALLLDIWTRNLKSHDAQQHADRYDWICRNPIGQPMFWMVLNGDEPIGSAGLSPRTICIDGRTVRSGVAGDFAVDTTHRLLQPALLLQKSVLGALDAGVDVVYGLPNPNARKVCARQGYQQVGGLKRYVKVLRTGRFLKAAKGWRSKTAALSPVLDLWIRSRSPETWHRVPGDRAIQTVSSFDDRFDELWSRLQGRPGIMGVRSSEFLRWRYPDCPLQQYDTLALTDASGGRVLGYITAYPSDDDKQVRVADLVTDGSEGAAADVLAALIAHSRRNGGDSISFEFLGAPPFEPDLQKFGFVQRECEAQLMVAAKPPIASESFFRQCADWYFLRGDENVNTR